MLVRVLSLLAVCAGLLSGTARAAPPLLYVALGDSTAVGIGAEHGGGYPDRIARRLGAAGVPVRLVNLGAPGATVSDLRRAQLPRLLADRPSLVTIGIGLNDALAGRPLAEFARELEVVADSIARIKAAVIVSELPDVSRSPSAGGTARSLARRISAYNATLRRVAERHGFVVAELETTSRRAFKEGTGLFARDGFHPSGRGYDLWTDAMWPAVERVLAPRVQARRPVSASPER